MAGEIIVVSCGMMTPVGLSASETAGSARSRTPRLTEIKWHDSRSKGFVVAFVPEDGLPDLDAALEKPPLSYREVRMLRLTEMPVKEALAALPQKAGPVPVILGLPELQTTVALQGGDFLGRLAKQTKANLALAQSAGLPKGRAAGLLAVKEASAHLLQRKAEFVLAGGVDTYVDLYIMGTLDMQKRVRTGLNADGFAPGEGAGFVLLTTSEAARKYSLRPLAQIVTCAAGHEEGHINSDEPYKGEGLALTFEALFSAADKLPPVSCVYASFNGERYWAKEFGVAMLRHRERFKEDHQMEHPAECFGDLGAAHGSVMLGLACLGIKAGYRQSPALVYASSDYGTRAAVLVAAA